MSVTGTRFTAYGKYVMIALLCGLVLAFYVRYDQVAFSTDDTVQVNLLAAGAFFPRGRYLIYSNILYGIFLDGLYALFPSVNWYLFCGLFCNLCAVVSICFFLCRNLTLTASVPATLMCMLFFSRDFFLSVHYTTNVYLYAAAGFFWLLEALKREQKRFLIPAVWFLVLASTQRTSAFFMICPFFFVVVAVRLFFRPALRKDRQALRKKLILLTVPFAAAVLCAAVDAYAYAKDPAWSQFTERNKTRVEIQDRGFLNYPEYHALYDEAGIPMSAINLVTNWLDNDPEVFSPERLRRIADIKNSYDPVNLRFDPEILAECVHGVLSRFYFGQSYLPWFCVGGILALALLRDRERLWMALLMYGLTFAFYYVLYCYGRLGWHAETGLWLTPLLLPFGDLLTDETKGPSLSDTSGRDRLLHAGFAVSAVTLALLTAAQVRSDPQKNRLTPAPFTVTDAAEPHEVLEYICMHKDRFYVVSSPLGRGYWGAKTVYDINGLHRNDYENVCFLGGWFAASPAGMYHANRAGITNPVRALFEREETFLVAQQHEAEWIWYFLVENYRPDITYEKTDEVAGAGIWRFHAPSDPD